MSNGDYIVNTPQIREAADQLRIKAEEMRAAVAAIDTKMAPVRGMKGGTRINKDLQQWDTLKSSLEKMFPAAEEASRIIKMTADDVDRVFGT